MISFRSTIPSFGAPLLGRTFDSEYVNQQVTTTTQVQSADFESATGVSLPKPNSLCFSKSSLETNMSKKVSIPEEVLMSKIYMINEVKVMLDSDLAELYQVETKVLNQAVKRNIERFPDDFMFRLTAEQWGDLKSQNVTSSWGGRRTLPFVFTEQGVAMLSSVLNSGVAIQVNIQIVRVFTKMREMLLTHKDLLLEIEGMRKRVGEQDEKIELIFNYLKQFVKDQEAPRIPIGFKIKK